MKHTELQVATVRIEPAEAAPSALDLRRAADNFIDGPNVEFSPWGV